MWLYQREGRKEYVPVCLSACLLPALHRCESAQVRELIHLPHLALGKGHFLFPGIELDCCYEESDPAVGGGETQCQTLGCRVSRRTS